MHSEIADAPSEKPGMRQGREQDLFSADEHEEHVERRSFCRITRLALVDERLRHSLRCRRIDTARQGFGLGKRWPDDVSSHKNLIAAFRSLGSHIGSVVSSNESHYRRSCFGDCEVQ